MCKSPPETIEQIHSRFADGSSPVTLVEACLSRIDEENDRSRAMIFVARAEALGVQYTFKLHKEGPGFLVVMDGTSLLVR